MVKAAGGEVEEVGGGDYVVPWSESGGVFSLSSLCLALNFALSVTELVSQAIS